MLGLFGALLFLTGLTLAVGVWEWTRRRQDRLAASLRYLASTPPLREQVAQATKQAAGQFPRPLQWIERRAKAAGVEVAPQTAMVVLAAGMAALFVGALAVTGTLSIAVLASLGGLYAPVLYLERQAQRRADQAMQQLDRVCQGIGQAMRAGDSLQKALAAVGADTRPPLGPEIERVLRLVNYSGAPLREAVQELAQRIRLPETRLLVAAMRLHLDTGCNLPAIMDRLSHRIRARRETRAVLRTATAQARMQAYVLVGLPLFLTLVVRSMYPAYFEPLFGTTGGKIVFLFALCLDAVGYLVMRRMMQVE